jgi:hypothetical protein
MDAKLVALDDSERPTLRDTAAAVRRQRPQVRNHVGCAKLLSELIWFLFPASRAKQKRELSESLLDRKESGRKPRLRRLARNEHALTMSVPGYTAAMCQNANRRCR